MSTKSGFMLALKSLKQMTVPIISSFLVLFERTQVTGDWLTKYYCFKVCMKSSSKHWIPVFNALEQEKLSVVLAHPEEIFDVTPFVDGRCKTPIVGIQTAVVGAISPKQTIKLRQYPDHIDELNKHIEEM